MLLGFTEKTQIIEHFWIEYLEFAKATNAEHANEEGILIYDFTEPSFWEWYTEYKMEGQQDANATETA